MTNKTTHEDLVNISGNWTYMVQNNIEFRNTGTVNGTNTQYKILDYVESENENGLNAVTLENTSSGL